MKNDPFTRDTVQTQGVSVSAELDDQLMQFIKEKSFLKARLKCAFTILAITGVAELSSIKVKQIIILITSNYCPIYRKKRGPSADTRTPLSEQCLRKRKAGWTIENKLITCTLSIHLGLIL